MTTESDQEVYDRIAADLAVMRAPDLSDFSPTLVDLAMARAFTPDGPRPEWLTALQEQVSQLSNGLVRLENADRTTFPFLIKDPTTAYQLLVGIITSRLLVIGPFTPPVQFMP